MPELLQFIAANGEVTELSSLPGVRALGDRGMDMPPVRFIEDEVPQQAGTRIRGVRTLAREVTIPFYLEQDSDQAVRLLLRKLARRFYPAAGDGVLRVTSFDGSMRDLACRYTEGLQGSRVRGDSGIYWRRGALVFRAADPFWYDTAPTSQTYTTGVQQPFLGDPFLPLRLNSDTVLGSRVIDNTGDVEAFPVWTINGPASSVTLTNDTTGQSIMLPIALTAAQTVVIDTRPGRKTVTLSDGTNLYGALDTASALWTLPVGPSTVTTLLPGAGAATYVTLTYYRRWLTP